MLTIKDLATTRELDAQTMTTVQGGTGLPLADIQNSFNQFKVFNLTDFRPDYSTDVLAQLNVGDISANNNFGSVVIPQLAQANGGANG